MLTDFHGDEAKKIEIEKKIKMADSKKLRLSMFFCENFRDWSLGE
jgi:hypothetical protein